VLGFRSAELLAAVELVVASAADADPAFNDGGAPEAAVAAVPLTTEFWLIDLTPALVPAGPADGGGGAASGASILPRARPSPADNANPEATAPAVTAPLITVVKVLPISPRTMRLAMKGISAIMIEIRTLATLMTII